MLRYETSAPRDLDSDTFMIGLHVYHHTLDQQADDFLALCGRRLRRMPQLWNVVGESHDVGSFVVGELPRLILEEAIVLLLARSLCPQCLFPTLLQGTGHQTILGLNRVVLSLRALRRLGRPFQPQLPLPVEAIPLLVDA